MDQQSLRKLIEDTILHVQNVPYVITGVSNRHIHLSRLDMDTLFGPGHELTPVKDLLQPGQYACKETVSAAGPKGRINNIRILGPVRGETQLELSMTDTFSLGVSCPINESGNLDKAGRIRIENPVMGTSIEKNCGIIALRHAHLTPETARKFNLRDKQFVSLEYGGKRGIRYGGVLLRVSDRFCDEIHLDTDEANAGAVKNGDMGVIVPLKGRHDV
ncbi:MAG: phosphate propanoyltransferase [Treponema sp.]|jgi:putative phosphotransacetylase|nr:phosphate propanoyltransferase [Treponema sp.]